MENETLVRAQVVRGNAEKLMDRMKAYVEAADEKEMRAALAGDTSNRMMMNNAAADYDLVRASVHGSLQWFARELMFYSQQLDELVDELYNAGLADGDAAGYNRARQEMAAGTDAAVAPFPPAAGGYLA